LTEHDVYEIRVLNGFDVGTVSLGILDGESRKVGLVVGVIGNMVG
jgi:hypothetical protein